MSAPKKKSKAAVEQCENCYGRGWKETSSCLHGCCDRQEIKCEACKGSGKVIIKYKFVTKTTREWVKV